MERGAGFGDLRERWQKLGRGRYVILLALVLAFALYASFRQMGEEGRPGVRHQRPVVKTMVLKRADMNRHILLSGQTTANADIALAPKYTGRVAEVLVKLGDEVEEGQVLLVQDTSDLDISIKEQSAAAGAARADAREAAATYNANYIKARNNYELEKSKYERNEYLFSIGAISQDKLDSVKQEYLASLAAFEILENQVEGGGAASVQSKIYTAEKTERAADGLRQQREDMVLRAPRAGIIGYRQAEVGQIASAGTKVLSLVDNSHLNVDCRLSEADAAILNTGMEVMVTVDAMGEDYPGRIVYVSPAMDDTVKSYQVRIELLGDDLQLKAGLFAHTALDILQRRDTLFVPKEAVLSRNGRQTVFVLAADGTAEAREVRIGLMNDEYNEIISGLSEGDVVIISNLDRLQQGMAVDVADGDESREADNQ